MSINPVQTLRLRLRCDASAPKLAREAVGKLDVSGGVRDDALLVVSELATNAVLHSGCDPSEEIEVVAEFLPDALRIAVTDAGRSGSTPAPRAAEDFAPGGMGLRVVQAIARGWGAERLGGMRVWAELPR
jgi:anti-sigma regulatory factor (Ser/Thr protein kinase)